MGCGMGGNLMPTTGEKTAIFQVAQNSLRSKCIEAQKIKRSGTF